MDELRALVDAQRVRHRRLRAIRHWVSAVRRVRERICTEKREQRRQRFVLRVGASAATSTDWLESELDRVRAQLAALRVQLAGGVTKERHEADRVTLGAAEAKLAAVQEARAAAMRRREELTARLDQLQPGAEPAGGLGRTVLTGPALQERAAAELLATQQFEQAFGDADYDRAVRVAADSPGGCLLTMATFERFRRISVPPARATSIPPHVRLCMALMERQPARFDPKQLSLDCVQAALHWSHADAVAYWIGHRLLVPSPAVARAIGDRCACAAWPSVCQCVYTPLALLVAQEVATDPPLQLHVVGLYLRRGQVATALEQARSYGLQPEDLREAMEAYPSALMLHVMARALTWSSWDSLDQSLEETPAPVASRRAATELLADQFAAQALGRASVEPGPDDDDDGGHGGNGGGGNEEDGPTALAQQLRVPLRELSPLPSVGLEEPGRPGSPAVMLHSNFFNDFSDDFRDDSI